MNFDSVLVVALVLAGILVVSGVVFAVARRSRRPELPAAAPPKVEAAAPDVGARLGRARSGFGDRLKSLFGAGLDTDTWESLEEVLIASDVGVTLATELVNDVQAANPEDAEAARRALSDRLHATLAGKFLAAHHGYS